MVGVSASEIRNKYLSFFKKRGHIEIVPAPLILEDDPTTLFTSSGMQPLVEYLMGKPHPLGKRLTDSQPCIRLQDIDEVGDNRHTTFFEMLGNWSLGDYFKEEQLSWVLEFFTKELDLPKERLWVSVFEGLRGNGVSDSIRKDTESIEIWKKLGIPEERIFEYGSKKNWWSRSGTPDEMPIGEIGGPDSEVFFDFGEELKIHERSAFRDLPCHPNCDCGRFLEIGNSVFIQYKKVGDGKLEELPQKNVDFGGGLERITAAVNGNPDIFKTDLFSDLISQTESVYKVTYGESDEKVARSVRIIVEHLRASAMLISSGVLPGNKAQGYVLRRLLRRAIFHSYLLDKSLTQVKIPRLDCLIEKQYPIQISDIDYLHKVIEEEGSKFFQTLKSGINIVERRVREGKIDGKFAFDLFQSHGIPLDLTLEIMNMQGVAFTPADRKVFEEEFKRHKDLSRTTSAGVFKGGLADYSPEVVRLHTATHLLLASLRKVLGEHVVQMGQNITRLRSRFDFSNPDKLTDEQVKDVEKMINDVVEMNLPVSFKVMPKDEAIKTGAIHAFNEKYSDVVKVYYVGNSLEDAFSKEFCGGPHVDRTGQIGRVRITRQEKIGGSLVRVYLELKE
jgi:alanyl-tRNA synthetase